MPQLLMPLEHGAHMQVNIPHICALVRKTKYDNKHCSQSLSISHHQHTVKTIQYEEVM